ncbi:viroplasmin family protein [Aeromonas media]|uniref:ribonuclease H1 domain-containing protein n=1 Tax=Aeromonas media TaxID=651 RepID=UPI003D1E4B0C
MSKSTHYVVWVGRVPGVYSSWAETELQTKGFSGAKFKGFPSLAAAELAFAGDLGVSIAGKPHIMPVGVGKAASHAGGRPGAPYLSVDAAYSSKTNLVEWRGVLVTQSGQKEVFRSSPYVGGSANVGEYLAIVDGIKWICEHMGDATLPIYSDSFNAQTWVARKAHNSNVPSCDAIRGMLDEANAFLQAGGYDKVKRRIPLRDWVTKLWGEIPADFGRK